MATVEEQVSCMAALVILLSFVMAAAGVWHNRDALVLEVHQAIAGRQVKRDIKRFEYVREALPRARDYAIQLHEERLERELWLACNPDFVGLNPHPTHRYHELEAQQRYETLRQEWNRLNRPSFSLLVGTQLAEHFYLDSELPA